MGLPVALTPGTVIDGHYIIGSLINSGGFGAVYRGTDTGEGNRPCAIKELYNVTPAVRRQALMEASVLLTIRSKHLPDVYDALEFNGRFYLVMELIEGQNLLQLLRSRLPAGLVGEQQPYQQSQGPCSEREVLAWLLPVIDVLQELHSRNPPIMHRDIKPGNIILKPDQTAVLVDFGLSKLYDPNRNTQTMLKAVTEGFSPPEQYIGKTTPQSDIYSMAATIYLLLTNRRPPQAINRSVNDALLPPRQLNPSLSPKIERVLLKALSIDASQRYPGMREFGQALREPSFDAFSNVTVAISSGGPQGVPQTPGGIPVSSSAASRGKPRPPGGSPAGNAPLPQPNGPTSPRQIVAPRVMMAPARPLPTVFGQGCLWGLLQGVLAGLLVAFTQQPVNFYCAILMGFCFYVISGLAATRRGGSPWRGFWTGFWSGIFSTITFWIVFGLGYAIRFTQSFPSVARSMRGASSSTVFNATLRSIQTALPAAAGQSRTPSNLLILFGGGLLLAALLGFLGGLFGRSLYRSKMAQRKQYVPHP